MISSDAHLNNYRCGIIGLGRIASLLEKDALRKKPCTHAGFYDQQANCELVTGSDCDRTRRDAFANDWKIDTKHLYADYAEMLSKEALDLVSICAYAPARLEMCEAALNAGAKGLWIEKTLGCSLADALAIQTLLNKHGAKAVVDYPRRARRPFRVVKRLIEANTFGRLQTVTCHMTHQLLHTGTHAYDLLRYWCGEAEAISGNLELGLNPNEIQDQGGVGQIRMSCGTTAFVSALKKRYYIFQFDLIFDRARILLGNDIQKIYLPEDSKNYSGFKELFESNDFDWSDPYRENLLQDLTDAIDANTEPLCSVHNAIEALKIGLGLFLSHQKEGRWVHPSEIPPDFYVPNL